MGTAGRSSTEILSAADEVTVIGRQVDTAVAASWAGHNVLQAAKWSIPINDDWVAAAILQSRTVYVASPRTAANLFDDVLGQETVFARELRMFTDAGYTPHGDYLLAPG